jgi:hypothetical protein
VKDYSTVKCSEMNCGIWKWDAAPEFCYSARGDLSTLLKYAQECGWRVLGVMSTHIILEKDES